MSAIMAAAVRMSATAGPIREPTAGFDRNNSRIFGKRDAPITGRKRLIYPLEGYNQSPGLQPLRKLYHALGRAILIDQPAKLIGPDPKPPGGFVKTASREYDDLDMAAKLAQGRKRRRNHVQNSPLNICCSVEMIPPSGLTPISRSSPDSSPMAPW